MLQNRFWKRVNPIFSREIPKHPTRDPFGSTWPDHFSKADDGPDLGTGQPGYLHNVLHTHQPVRSCVHKITTY